MPIDPNIALGVRGIEVPNPLNQLAQVSQLQSMQQAGELNALKMQELKAVNEQRNALRQLNPTAADYEAQLFKVDPALGIQYRKEARAAEQAEATTAKTKLEIAAKQTEAFRDLLQHVKTPEQAAQWVQAQYSNPYLGPVVSQVPMQQALGGIPTDPKGLQAWKNQNAVGMTDWVKRNTMTAAESAADQRAREKLAQDERSVVYQTDDQGNVVALPSKLRAGEVPRARVAVAPGAGMTPLEGKPSEKVASERLSINQQKATVQGAIDAVKNTPDAFGWTTGNIPEAVRARTATSAENEARAFVFNVVSGVIKERAGTAQSAGEAATLARFLPADTDNAKIIEDKLTGFQKYLDAKESGTSRHPKKETPAPSATGNSVTLPDGRVMTFPDANAASQFKKAAGL